MAGDSNQPADPVGSASFTCRRCGHPAFRVIYTRASEARQGGAPARMPEMRDTHDDGRTRSRRLTGIQLSRFGRSCSGTETPRRIGNWLQVPMAPSSAPGSCPVTRKRHVSIAPHLLILHLPFIAFRLLSRSFR